MNHTAMKIIGGTIGMLSIVALTLAAALAVNTSPADAKERNLTESAVDLRYLTSNTGGSSGDHGQRLITRTNERIAQEFRVGQGGPDHAADGLGAHKYSILKIEVEQTWSGRHASAQVDARIYHSLGSGADLRPHAQVCTLEYASHNSGQMTFHAPDYGCRVHGLESYFAVFSLKDASNNAEIEITNDAASGYDNWDMAGHFLASSGGSKTWTSESGRLRVAITARALYEDPPDVAYTRPKSIRANEGEPTTYHAKMVSKPRIGWNFRVDTVHSELPSTMVCPGHPIPPPSLSCLITPDNWGSAIPITVTPPHDDDGDGAKFLMKHQVFQTDPKDGNETASWEEDTLRIVVTDDDRHEFRGPSSFTMPEGEIRSLILTLGAKPAGDIPVTVTVAGPFVTSEYIGTFTGNEWKDGYGIVLETMNDDVALEKTGSLTVSYTPNAGDEDPAWADTRPLTIPIRIEDDDTPGFYLAPVVGAFNRYCPPEMTTECDGYHVEIDEDDFIRYIWKLDTEPLEPVTIRATRWRGVRVIENSEFTYDSTNWDSCCPPVIRVKANRFAFDARDRYAEVRYQVTSSGPDYKDMTIPPLRVTIKNIDPN